MFIRLKYNRIETMWSIFTIESSRDVIKANQLLQSSPASQPTHCRDAFSCQDNSHWGYSNSEDKIYFLIGLWYQNLYKYPKILATV